MNDRTGGHISDELPRLLTGEAKHDVVMLAAEHLRTCPDCQQELVSAVVSHASLRSAQRFAPEIVAPLPKHDLPQSRVVALRGADDAPDQAGEQDEPESDPLPDMSAMFDRVRTEAALASSAPSSSGQSEQTQPGANRARGRRGLFAVAAAAVVLAGGGIAAGVALEGNGSNGQTVALHAFDAGTADATAHIKGDTVTLDAASVPKLSSGQRYEVWLTNDQRNQMYSIGFMGDGSSASFTVKRSELTKFSDIEVSVQKAGKLPYSGTSVLRGSYA